MPLNHEVRIAYEVVLKDLEAERQQVQQQIAPLQARLKELHYSIIAVSKRLSPDASIPPLAASPVAARTAGQKYANVSVRWAVLDLLDLSEPMNTAEIADALLGQGIQTKAANFANNVSAVLGTMFKEPHNEVHQLGDGKWQLTENGKSAIAHIRTTLKWRRSIAAW